LPGGGLDKKPLTARRSKGRSFFQDPVGPMAGPEIGRAAGIPNHVTVADAGLR